MSDDEALEAAIAVFEQAIVARFNRAGDAPRLPTEPFAFQIERFRVAMHDDLPQLMAQVRPGLRYQVAFADFLLSKVSTIPRIGIVEWAGWAGGLLRLNPNPNDTRL